MTSGAAVQPDLELVHSGRQKAPVRCNFPRVKGHGISTPADRSGRKPQFVLDQFPSNRTGHVEIVP